MTARRPGLSTTAIHGVLHRRPDWTPGRPRRYPERHLRQSGRLRRGDALHPVRQQPQPGRARRGSTPCSRARRRRSSSRAAWPPPRWPTSPCCGPAITCRQQLDLRRHPALFDEEFGRFGIDVTYVEPDKPRAWRKAVRKATRAIFVETPTNPLTRVVDLAPMAQVAQEFGLALLVDSTFASPINFRPLEHGADVVITSATKYLNGHSDVIAGAVAGSASVIEEVTRLMRLWGQSIDPHAAWLVDRGMRTLALRMERHNANGMAVARWAEEHAGIAEVHYPGLPSHPDHDLARERARRLRRAWWASSSRAARRRRALASSRLKLITHAPSLAGVETLISEPRLTSHKGAHRRGARAPSASPTASCG